MAVSVFHIEGTIPGPRNLRADPERAEPARNESVSAGRRGWQPERLTACRMEL